MGVTILIDKVLLKTIGAQLDERATYRESIFT